MASVYILFSKTLNRHYIGSCADLEKRLQDHRYNRYNNAFTSKVDDWVLIHRIDHLEYHQARNIEKHIKRMRSSQYIINLMRYPEMNEKLINKYKTGSPR